MTQHEPAKTVSKTTSFETPRRGFLIKAVTILIGGLVGLVPAAIGGIFFFDPLLRKRKPPSERKPSRDEEGFIKVTSLEAIPENGVPQKFTVIADSVDAWTFYPNQRIGNVILRRVSAEEYAKMSEAERSRVSTLSDSEEESEPKGLMAFTDVCPHLGCSVDYKSTNPPDAAFSCPCHNSAFSLTGERGNEIPPRNLDSLQVKINNDDEVWVKYESFQPGKKEEEKTIS